MDSLIEQEAAEYLRLVSFKKVNDQEMNLLGMPLYSIEFIGKLEVLKDGEWKKMGFTSQEHSGFEIRDDWWDPTIEIRNGQRLNISGRVVFEKTEKGWRASGIESRLTDQTSS